MIELEEQWVEFDSLPIAVSNYGRVINTNTQNEIPQRANKRGKHCVSIRYLGKKYELQVHRLVAMAFFLNYKNGIEVLHINGNYSDNAVLNLTLGNGCRKAEYELS